MKRKIITIVIAALCLSIGLSACHPELSVQQYDQLKEDIVKLDEERTALREEIDTLTEQLDTVKEKNAVVRKYVNFIVQLIATQNSESLLKGEFDVAALTAAKDALLEAANKLEDQDIHYYMTLIDEENEAETVGAYYKAIEYCIKNIKQELGVPPSSNQS